MRIFLHFLFVLGLDFLFPLFDKQKRRPGGDLFVKVHNENAIHRKYAELSSFVALYIYKYFLLLFGVCCSSERKSKRQQNGNERGNNTFKMNKITNRLMVWIVCYVVALLLAAAAAAVFYYFENAIVYGFLPSHETLNTTCFCCKSFIVFDSV